MNDLVERIAQQIALEEEENEPDEFISEAELDKLPDPAWLIPSWLMVDTTSMLFGPPGSGKSFAALDWAFHVAAGRGGWSGTTPVPTGKVLYVAGEGVAGIKKRRNAWRKAHQVDGPIDVTFLRQGLNVVSQTGARWNAALEWVSIHQPILVVLDTLARCSSGADESSSKDMGRFIHGMDRLRKASGGAAVLVLHHTTKAGSEFRGSSALSGGMDTMVRLSGGRMDVTKHKDADLPKPISMRLQRVPGTQSVIPVFGNGN